MTPEYTALRSKINEVFPERLKLEFGCEIVRKGKTTTVYAHFDALNAVRCIDGTRGDGFPVREIDEILGKPITIADVLMALEAVNAANKTKTWLETGGAFKVLRDDGLWHIVADFTLSLPLSHPENAPSCAAVLRLLENK